MFASVPLCSTSWTLENIGTGQFELDCTGQNNSIALLVVWFISSWLNFWRPWTWKIPRNLSNKWGLLLKNQIFKFFSGIRGLQLKATLHCLLPGKGGSESVCILDLSSQSANIVTKSSQNCKIGPGNTTIWKILKHSNVGFFLTLQRSNIAVVQWLWTIMIRVPFGKTTPSTIRPMVNS